MRKNPTARSTRRPAPGWRRQAPPVVGIGASAGGLEAVTQLLSNLPTDTGFSFAVILHLDPTHESTASEILTRATRIPVSDMKDGMRLQPNHVYVIPSNTDAGIANGMFKIVERSAGRGMHMPIDLFLSSIASHSKEQSIGVVLSGTASDGTLGLQRIKAEGGITFAQKPQSAKFDSMPRSAIHAGAVDIVGSPVEIARELSRIATHPYVKPALHKVSPEVQLTQDNDEKHTEAGEPLDAIFGALRTATNLDFSQYKSGTVNRRIKRRMILRKKENLAAYAKLVQEQPDEIKALVEDLLINVTQFFRDPSVFTALQARAFPRLFKNRPKEAAIRVWVPGCATGEEAYSLAIALLEFVNAKRVMAPIQIFATDVSESAIQKARRGFYPEGIAPDVPPHLLRKYFEKADGGYRVRKAVRDTCLFSIHDITRDPPFARMELISCRNVLIYFNGDLQKRVVPIFHFALNPNGVLLLGRAETLSAFANLFTLADKVNKIYTKRELAPKAKPTVPFIPFAVRHVAPSQPAPFADSRSAIQKEADRLLLEKYAPPSVLVDANFEIVMTRGHTSPYLSLAPGQPSLNVLRMVTAELSFELRQAIQSAKKNGAPVEVPGLRVKEAGDSGTVTLRVSPLRNPSQAKEWYFSIEFQEEHPRGAKQVAPKQPVKRAPSTADDRKREEREFFSQQQYQNLLAEFDSMREEFVAANEELQSSNEELQSTNEEIETAKEELQSGNEELSTVNEELQNRNSEISQLNADLNNLLVSIDIPIIMVGEDGRIRRFTPKATQVLNIIPSDIGRPIGDIKPKIKAVDLDEIIFEVMETMTTKVIETQDLEGKWHKLIARPYRTLENKIDGAVLAMLNIDDVKRAALDLKKAHDDTQTILETLPIPLLVIEPDLTIRFANGSFYEKFRVTPEDTEGKHVAAIGSGQWDIPELLKLIRKTFAGNAVFDDFEVEHDFPQIGLRYMLLNARPISLAGSKAKVALLSIEDITLRKDYELELQAAKEKYENLLLSAHDPILILNSKGRIEFLNDEMKKVFGYASQDLMGQPFLNFISRRNRKDFAAFLKGYLASPVGHFAGNGARLFGLRKDGSEIPINLALSPAQSRQGTLVTAVIRDISETLKMEEERVQILRLEKEAREQAEAANRTKDIFLATLSHELRTPLTSILAWAELIQSAALNEEKTKHGLRVIEESGRALGQLINDLMDVSRIQAGKISLSKKLVKPSELLLSAAEAVRLEAARKGLEIEVKQGPGADLIYADPALINQVLLNLLTNGIKFSNRGGKIQASTREVRFKDGKYCQFSVTDFGKGIDSKFLPKIFEQFSQQDSTSTRAHGGLGLGLAIVRGIVELHGGSVNAESAGVGKGATFNILLPMASKARPSTPAKKIGGSTPRRSAVKLNGLRVMFVEDEASSRDAIGEILRGFGATVLEVESVEKAVKAFPVFRPAILLSDIAMPGRDGYSLIRHIRRLTAKDGGNTPSIALTAYANEEDRRRVLAAGFDAYLTKPLQTDALAALLTKKWTKSRPPSS